MPECLATLWALLSLLPWQGRDVLRVVVQVLVTLQQLLLTKCLPRDGWKEGVVMGKLMVGLGCDLFNSHCFPHQIVEKE